MIRTRNPRLKKLYDIRRVHGCPTCQGNCYGNTPKGHPERSESNRKAILFELGADSEQAPVRTKPEWTDRSEIIMTLGLHGSVSCELKPSELLEALIHD